MFVLRALGYGFVTAVVMWLYHVAVCLGAMPGGPDYRGEYFVAIGGALFSAYRSAKYGARGALLAAAAFFVPVAAMCLHLLVANAPYNNGGKEQWRLILACSTIVTFGAAIALVYLRRHFAFLQNDD